MPFLGGKELKEAYSKAKKEGYAFTANNIAETNVLIGLLEAAKEKDSDLVLQLSNSAAKFAGNGDPVAGLRVLSNTIKELSKDAPVAVFLNIDHAKPEHADFLNVAIGENLVSSVMVDASSEPFEENIKITSKVVEAAHKRNIIVEGELGKIKGQEDDVISDEHLYTDPEEALEYVKKTGLDLLAIAIGTNHGVTKGKNVKLRLDIAEDIDKKLTEKGCEIPLVLHGASGLLPGQVKGAIKNGICKVNKDTRYQHEYGMAALAFYRENGDEIICPNGMDPDKWTPNKKKFDPRVVSKAVRQAVKEAAMELMDQVGSSGKSILKK